MNDEQSLIFQRQAVDMHKLLEETRTALNNANAAIGDIANECSKYVSQNNQLRAELEKSWISVAELTEKIEQQKDKLADSQAKCEGLEKDKESLINHFIDRANCAADNMEGEDGSDFTQYETRMVCAIETLEVIGVKYDPISGSRSATMKQTQ